MKRGKLTVKEILELLDRCDKFYAPLIKKFEEDEKYYELNFKDLLDIPVDFENEGVVLPTARDMVDTFVDHIDISNARVFVNRKGTSNISAEEAEMMRKFYLGLIHRTNVESDISPWRVLAKHYALHGLGVCKTIYDADRWPSKPEQKKGESEEAYNNRVDEWRATRGYQSLPIVIQAVNPACILPDPGYGGRMFNFERHKRLVMDISPRWPNWTTSKTPSEEVEYISYWDADYRCDLIDREPILKGDVVKHNYGFIPYVLIDSGLGNISSENKPEMRYVGLLRYIFELLVAESRDFSISDIVLAKTAWPWGYLKVPHGVSVPEIKQTFGTYNPIPDTVEIKEMVAQVPPDALNAHLFRTSDYIAAHAAPRSLRGLSEPGVRSGADRRLVIAEAAARYRYSEDAFKNGTANILTNCATLMKNVIPGNVRLWARTPSDEFDDVIDRDKMREPFTCYVEFAPISEEDEYRRHTDIQNMVNTGIYTEEFAWTQMSNVDPEKMKIHKEKAAIRQMPSYLEIKQHYAAGKLAKAISKREGAEAIVTGAPMGVPGQPPAPGAPPGAMVPGVPERAQPGSAEQIGLDLEKLTVETAKRGRQGQGGGGARR